MNEESAMTTAHDDDLAAVREAGLLTGRYSTFKPEHGVPVRTSVGRPRFWRHGELPYAKRCTPHGVFKNPDLESLEDQEAVYRLNLSTESDDVIAELAEIAREHPGRPLVLLCYEDTSQDVCHRQWLAA
jgi:hypothetical protein